MGLIVAMKAEIRCEKTLQKKRREASHELSSRLPFSYP
jgi:hypothetical protein